MITDPRFVRSADALRRAVLELARERQVEHISVTEIAKVAGVTRATFYNHATSPQALLTGILRRELDALAQYFLDRVRAQPDQVFAIWNKSGHLLLDHIESHHDVYRTGLASAESEAGSVLASLLGSHIEGTLHVYLGMVAAPAPEDALQRTRLAIRASFLSHGMVGAYRAWLLSEVAIPRDEAVAMIFESTPEWWFTVGTTGA